jgi:DNA-binding GntR family transcriptional regulator
MAKMELAFESLNHSDLTEQTYAVLRNNILRRSMTPGTKISVTEVAQALGVSRTPVMDALKRLAADGLVEIVPRRGTFVTELNARDVSELFDIRVMMELHAANHILRTKSVDQFLLSIEESLKGMELATVNGDYADYEAFLASDRDLHLKLMEQTRNQRLIQMYREMNLHIQIARTHYFKHVEKALQAQQEHQAIVRAFRKDDAGEVRLALSTHIMNVKERMLEVLEERGGSL